MNTLRQNKVSRLIQKELGKIFQVETSRYFPGGMISVTAVRISPDLGLAKIYLSIFPAKDKSGVLASINDDIKSIRYKLSQQIKMIRKMPELAFFIDDSLDYIDNINKLLKQ